MKYNILTRKWHKTTAVTVLILSSIILILAVLINSYWSPILAMRVKSVVLTSSDSLYTANFSSAELHIIRGELIIYNISLKPDTAVYNRRKKQHLAPNNLVELHVKRLILYHIHPFKLYFEHKLDINEIILTQPELSVSYELNHIKDTVVKDRRSPWQKISKSLESVHIGQIFLNDVKLKYSDYSGNKVAVSELKEMELSANDLLIDSTTQHDKSRVLFCKEIITELYNYSGKSPNGLYSYKIDHLKLSTLTSELNAEGLTLAPISTTAFFNKTNKDKYTIRLDSLQLNHFDYLSYHKYRMFHASVMTLNRGTMELFNNPNGVPGNGGADKIKSFPAVALSKLTTDIIIDTILVRNVNVAYSEFNAKSNQTGTITFNNTTGSVLNVTNNKDALSKNNISTIQLETYFMNRGKLNVFFTFNLIDKDVSYNYKGSLGPMGLAAINTATVPFALVKITSGSVKRLDFDIHANSRVSSGKFVLLYNGVKVKLLKPDTTYGLKSKVIESLFANMFILKHDNPDKEGEVPRSFDINYIRPKDSPFFKTIWQTLLSGIKPSVGLDKKTEDAIAAQLTQQQINKQNRMEKRAARKERRAEKKLQQDLEKQQGK